MLIRSIASLLMLGTTVPAIADPLASSKDPIIVTGDRMEEAEVTADLAKAITWRPAANKPLPKHYEPVCIKIFGIDAEYSDVLADRMRDNIRALDISLGSNGCVPTLWVGFVPDSYAEVTRLSKQDPDMFGDLREFEIDRVLAGSKAAQAWFAREDKGIDGKPLKKRLIEIGGVEVTVSVNDGWKTNRIDGSIRVDMIGSIVLFDSKLAAGRSIRQLADYATIRALAPVRDLAEEAGNPISILTLFADETVPPAGLTEFDWAYLAGYYKLGEHAGPAAIHDAARRAFLDGLGNEKADKAGGPVGD